MKKPENAALRRQGLTIKEAIGVVVSKFAQDVLGSSLVSVDLTPQAHHVQFIIYDFASRIPKDCLRYCLRLVTKMTLSGSEASQWTTALKNSPYGRKMPPFEKGPGIDEDLAVDPASSDSDSLVFEFKFAHEDEEDDDKDEEGDEGDDDNDDIILRSNRERPSFASSRPIPQDNRLNLADRHEQSSENENCESLGSRRSRRRAAPAHPPPAKIPKLK